MDVLVVGATGFLGSEICRLLVAEGHAVRGLVRETSDPERVSALRSLGVATLVGDLKDPESVRPAVTGAEAVVSTATATRTRREDEELEDVDRDGQKQLVRIAAEAGVRRFVYISFSGGLGVDDPLTVAKRETEDTLRASGMTYTILRPSCFMEVWLSPHLGFDHPSSRITVYGEGTNPLSWISLRDVAAFAALALKHPEAENAVIELGGPDALSPLEVVEIFEEETGRDFEVSHVPREQLEQQKRSAADSMERAFAGLKLAVAAGNPIPMDETLRVFPHPLTSVREYARAVTA